MPTNLRLEDTSLDVNRSGYYEIRWTEYPEGGDGRCRTRSYSCRTKDRAVAEEIRRTFLSASAAVSNRAYDVRVERVIDEYLGSHVDLNGVTDSQRWSLKPVRDKLGRFTVADLTGSEIAKYRRDRGALVKDGTIRRELGALVAALKWARNKGGVLAADTILPVIDLPPASEPREQYLDGDEEARMWREAEALVRSGRRRLDERRIGVFVCLALATGARAGAIEGLTWDRVDFGAGLIDLREPGRRVSKKRRVAVPMSKRLRPVLEHWARISTGAGAEAGSGAGGVSLIGPVLMHTGSTYKSFARFAALHKFDITRHGLRHTFATLKLQRGATIWEVAGLLGDTPAQIEATYGHHCPQHLRTAVDL